MNRSDLSCSGVKSVQKTFQSYRPSRSPSSKSPFSAITNKGNPLAYAKVASIWPS